MPQEYFDTKPSFSRLFASNLRIIYRIFVLISDSTAILLQLDFDLRRKFNELSKESQQLSSGFGRLLFCCKFDRRLLHPVSPNIGVNPVCRMVNSQLVWFFSSKILPVLQQKAEEVSFASTDSVLNHAAMFIDRMFAYLGKAFYHRKRLDLCF